MEACAVNTCILPDEYKTATPEQQSKMEMACTVINAKNSKDCARKHQCTVDWINATPPSD